MTSDKKDGGMMHNAWLILEGDKKKSKEFIMKNSPVHKVFRKGNKDTFTLDGRYVGKLKRVILGAMQREDKPLGKPPLSLFLRLMSSMNLPSFI